MKKTTSDSHYVVETAAELARSKFSSGITAIGALEVRHEEDN